MNLPTQLWNDTFFDLIKTDFLLAKRGGFITSGPLLTTNITTDYIKTVNLPVQSQVPIAIGAGFTVINVSASQLDRPVIITATATVPVNFSVVMPNISDVTAYLTTANSDLELQYGDSFKLSVINLNTNAGHAVFANTAAADAFVPPQASTANMILPETISEFTYIIDPTATPANGLVVVNLGVSKQYADSQLALHVNNSTSAHFGQDLTSTGSAVFSTMSLGSNATIAGALTVTGSIASTGIAHYYATNPATSGTTGGLIVDGGVGAAGNSYFATNLSVAGAETVTGALNVSGIAHIYATNPATSGTSGALIVDGGIGTLDASFFGGDLTIDAGIEVGAGASMLGAFGVTGIAHCFATNPATSGTTGGLIVDGGIGAAGNSYFATNLSVAGAETVTGAFNVSGLTHVYNTTASTSISTGSLVIDGGLGLASDLQVGGKIVGGADSVSTTATWRYGTAPADVWNVTNDTLYIDKIGNMVTIRMPGWVAPRTGTADSSVILFGGAGAISLGYRPIQVCVWLAEYFYNTAAGPIGKIFVQLDGTFGFSPFPGNTTIQSGTSLQLNNGMSFSYVIS